MKEYSYIYCLSGLPMVAEREYWFWGAFNKVYRYAQGEHAIIFGGSGSGKTQSLVYPLIQSILDANESIVLHDCKFELFAHFGKKFKEAGYKVIVINFANPKYSHRWNPFDYPIQKWKKALKDAGKKPHEFRQVKENLSESIENIKDIAGILSYEEDQKNKYFWEGAGCMIAGAALLLAEEGKFDCINGKAIQMIYNNDKADEEKGKLLKEFFDTKRKIDDDSVLQSSSYLKADTVTKGNIGSTFDQKIEVLNKTPDVSYLTSGSDFDMRDCFEEKTAIFLLTQDEKDIYYPLVTIFLKQLYEVGVRLTREGKYESWPVKMNWLLEEMGILPELKNFKNIYNAARSRGLTIYGFIQSMADMVEKYGAEGTRTILENCRVQVYIHGETDETTSYFVKRCGKTKRYNKKTKQYEYQDLISSNTLHLFEKGRILFTIAGQQPYIAKLPPYTQYSFYQKPNKEFHKELFGEYGRQYDYYKDIKWIDLNNLLKDDIQSQAYEIDAVSSMNINQTGIGSMS